MPLMLVLLVELHLLMRNFAGFSSPIVTTNKQPEDTVLSSVCSNDHANPLNCSMSTGLSGEHWSWPAFWLAGLHTVSQLSYSSHLCVVFTGRRLEYSVKLYSNYSFICLFKYLMLVSKLTLLRATHFKHTSTNKNNVVAVSIRENSLKDCIVKLYHQSAW